MINLNILAISRVENIIIFVNAYLILIAVIIFISLRSYKSHKKKKMFLAVEELLNEYVAADPLYSKLEKSSVKEYDYILTTKEIKVYIMIIPNFHQGEICINSPTKWQFRKTYQDSSSRFVPRVDRLMRFEPPMEAGLRIKRLYIVYPSSKSLLRYINECEMEFVRPETDLNGCSVITYSFLLEHKDSIEL
ncbi:hypothetical protein EI71_00984 [Anaeroplasma bactoclasticum]|jgi:hypothetical protein|uniref:Uncharacterized protein n=1 Tax=Anaeroplasma bactoclasticum TaxID=2088 RepID=A0A397RNN7_9MOLU|nr:hypothetical protein [Anaeroplasma bactoclasticum]RIA75950.1 hypothetical protein EI71_00984 [Anaeroplasma bactoclasticum]